MSTPLEREIMKAHTLLDEGYELVADRRQAKTSGWRKPGRPVVEPLTAAVADEVIDALSDTYRVRSAYHRRVLTSDPAPDEALDWGAEDAPAATDEPSGDGAGGPQDFEPSGSCSVVTETYWSVSEIAEKADVTRNPVFDRIEDGTFEAKKDRNGEWKVLVTDAVRRFCGLLFEEVAVVDQPFYTSDEVAELTGLDGRNVFYHWRRCTLVDHPADGRKVALADESFLDLLRDHGVKPLVEVEGYPVTAADVAGCAVDVGA